MARKEAAFAHKSPRPVCSALSLSLSVRPILEANSHFVNKYPPFLRHKPVLLLLIRFRDTPQQIAVLILAIYVFVREPLTGKYNFT